MKNTVKNFMEEVSKNKELQEKLKAISKKVPQGADQKTLPDSALNEMITLAKEQGYQLSKEDFNVEKQALSEDELNAVASENTCGCFCNAAGEGSGIGYFSDGINYDCGCIYYGQGGDGRANDINCLCLYGGGGYDYWS